MARVTRSAVALCGAHAANYVQCRGRARRERVPSSSGAEVLPNVRWRPLIVEATIRVAFAVMLVRDAGLPRAGRAAAERPSGG
jgi:hypothetical protein